MDAGLTAIRAPRMSAAIGGQRGSGGGGATLLAERRALAFEQVVEVHRAARDPMQTARLGQMEATLRLPAEAEAASCAALGSPRMAPGLSIRSAFGSSG